MELGVRAGQGSIWDSGPYGAGGCGAGGLCGVGGGRERVHVGLGVPIELWGQGSIWGCGAGG